MKIFTTFFKKKAEKFHQKKVFFRCFQALKREKCETQTLKSSNPKNKRNNNVYANKKPELKSKINTFITEMKKKTETSSQIRAKSPNVLSNKKQNLNEKSNEKSKEKSKSSFSNVNKSNFSDILLPNKSNENDIFNQSFGYNEKICGLEEINENKEALSENSCIMKSPIQRLSLNHEEYFENADNPIDQIITNIRMFFL